MGISVKVIARVVNANSRWFTNKEILLMEAEIRTAIAVWVRYLQTRLPTYTDTVRGTLMPAARVARTVVPQRSISARAARKKEYIHWDGRRFPLGFNRGKNYATAALTHSRAGDGVNFTFNYHNELPYFIRNNLEPAPPGFILPSNPPWHVLEAAAIAFKLDIHRTIKPRLVAILGNLNVKVTTLRSY